MRAGHGNNRTPAHIADNYENTLPKLNGGVVRGYFKIIYVVLHYISQVFSHYDSLIKSLMEYTLLKRSNEKN